jgi:hypothetical protein
MTQGTLLQSHPFISQQDSSRSSSNTSPYGKSSSIAALAARYQLCSSMQHARNAQGGVQDASLVTCCWWLQAAHAAPLS